jgi:hypothetical protein
VPGENGIAQIIKPGLTSLTLVTLTVGLSLIETSFDNVIGATFGASYPFRPSQLAQRLIALLFVNQGLEVNQHGGDRGWESSQSYFR